MDALTASATFMWVAIGGPVGVAAALAAGLMLIANANRQVRDTAVLTTEAHENYEEAIRGVIEASGMSAAGDYVQSLKEQKDAALQAALAELSLLDARRMVAATTDPDAYLMFGAEMDTLVRDVARIRAEIAGLESAADAVVPALSRIAPILDDAAVEADNAATAAAKLARTIETLGQSETGGLVGQIINVAGALGIAADEAARAVGGVRALAIFQARGGSGRGGDPRRFMPGNSVEDMDLTEADAFLANLNSPSGTNSWVGSTGSGADREAPLNRLQAMLGTNDPAKAIEEWHETAMTALEDAQLLERGMLEEHNDYRLQIEQSYQDQRAALADKARAYEISAQSSALSNLAGLLSAFGSKSRALQIAALAVNTGIRIRETLQNAAAASVRALAELGPIAGPPAAAKIMAYGKVSAGLIAAQGIASAVGGSGAGGAGGSGAGGGQATPPPPQTQNVTIDLVGATGQQIDQFQAFADTFNEASRQGLMTNVTVRGI